MENKRFIKKFTNTNDYEAQKESIMELPYVALVDDTQKVIYGREKLFFSIK